jgi:hypothetical protein
MGRTSSIDKLDPKLKAECLRLIREGGHTVDELLAHLQAMGAPIKRTALADYKKRMESSLAKVREAQEVAGVWVKDLGEDPESKTGQLIVELLKTVAFRTLADMQDQERGAEAEELMLLARSVKDMMGAQKVDLEFRTKLREQWRKELAERAAAAAEQAVETAKASVGSQGLTEEAADRIRELVLGIVG